MLYHFQTHFCNWLHTNKKNHKNFQNTKGTCIKKANKPQDSIYSVFDE